ncbi:MAG: nuclear transport factor 2 family protein [Candidatus Dadabacteria bacterium]|nr:nuclear transport factor 2 family protein [Candidatus Dadabacteria bacterium]
MGYEKDQVIKANKKFYDALNRYDIELIGSVWLTDGRAKCVHAGWPIIRGWEAVRESWKSIFETGGFDHVDISDFFVEVKENSAWLNCVERATYSIDDRRVVVLAQATNIFELTEGEWKMALHHASLMPIPRKEIDYESLQ